MKNKFISKAEREKLINSNQWLEKLLFMEVPKRDPTAFSEVFILRRELRANGDVVFLPTRTNIENLPGGGGGGQVNTVVGGTDISVDATDPINPIVNFTGTLGGQVNTVVGTTDEISVNIADPVNPVVSLAAAVIASLALADSAIQAQSLQLSGAYSDEGVTDLVESTTVPVWSKRVGYPFSLTEWKFDIMIAPTGSGITLDVHKNGTTIYSTKPTIAAAAFVSSGGVLTASPTTFALTDFIEVFTDVVGSTIPGKGLKGDPIGTLI